MSNIQHSTKTTHRFRSDSFSRRVKILANIAIGVGALLAIALSGCAHNPRAHVTEEETVRVTRLTEERDVGYRLRHLEPPGAPVFYADVHFRVEAPEIFRGREIVLPIIKDTEGPLFQSAEFTVRIPACFLNGKRSTEVKLPDGTIQISTTDGLSFEGIIVEPASESSPAQRH